MQAIDKAMQHFSDSKEMMKIHVTEWDVDIYYSMMNVAQADAIGKYTGGASNVEALIQLARKEDGSPMFKTGDRISLMRNVDPRIIQRIAEQMNDGINGLEEEEKKQ